jgi:hypothetical protein
MNIQVLHPEPRTTAFAAELRQHEADAAALAEGGKAVEQQDVSEAEVEAVQAAVQKPLMTVGEILEAAYKAKVKCLKS